MPSSRRLLVLALVGLLSIGAIGASERRGDLLARHAYWQIYPSDVRSIAIDRRGKPWFECDGAAPIRQIKRQIEDDFALAAPWVRGAHIRLFDSTGRIWLTPDADPALLLAYSPKDRQWIERHDAGPDGASHAFCGPAIEDSVGRIFIADRAGCHLFDQGRWSYQPFYELNKKENAYFGDSHEFWVPGFAQDEHGRVYAWTLWGPEGCTGTLGFWVHEGTQWHQTLTKAGERAGRIAAVVPLADDRVLVCPESGKVSVARIDFSQKTDPIRLRHNVELLGAEDFRQRRAAEREILALGPHVLPLVRQARDRASLPEQRTRLKLIINAFEQAPPLPMINDFALTNARYSGRDVHGNAVLWAGTIGPDGRAGRTAAWLITPQAQVLPAPETITEWEPHALLAGRWGRLFLAEYRQGLGVLDHGNVLRPADQTDLPYDQILGQDREGRVYVRNRWHVAALDMSAPDTRRTLPIVAYELSASRAAACQDSDGRIIAKLASPGQAFLSIYQNGQFREMPAAPAGHAIDDASYLQPLSGGALVMQEEPGKDVFYFDGSQWFVYRGLRELIEQRHASLAKQIDNRHAGAQTYAGLRTDSRGNVWCVQWDHVDVYDGTRWRSFPAAGRQGPVPRPIECCLPTGQSAHGSGRMVLSDGAGVMLAQATSDGVQTNPLPGAAPLPTNLNIGIGVRLDSRGDVWLPRSADSATRIEDGHAEAVVNTGLPRLEDSNGRTWFVNPDQKRLVVLDRHGNRTQIAEPALSDDSTVVEQRPGVFWVNTRRGLRRFELSGAGPFEVTPDPDYFEKGIPKGACNGMWIDPPGSLWFSGSGRLYQIRLPE